MYHFRKEKDKVIERLDNWRNDIVNILISTFAYAGYTLGDVFRFWKTFEDLLITNGLVAVIMLDGELFPGRVTFTGSLDKYGDLSDAIVFTENGKTYTFTNWRTNENIVIVHNNYTEFGDINEVERYCSILADIDKSIKHNVIFSRYNPIPVVSDESEKNQLETVMANNENGKLGCIVSDNIGLNEGETIKTADITDVKNADKIQYLNKAHDDIVKRLCTWVLGIDVNNNTSKMAQQSVAEITSGEKLSQLNPFIKLKCRQDGIKEINKKFGFNISVTFSETWDALLKKEETDNPGTEESQELEENKESEVPANEN